MPVLLFNTRAGSMPGKLAFRWTGPYIIDKVIGDGTFLLRQYDGDPLGKPVNGFRLRPYHRKEDPALESGSAVAICHIEPLITRACLHGAPFEANQIAAHEDSDEEAILIHDASLKTPYGRCGLSNLDTWQKFIGGFPKLIILIWAGSNYYIKGCPHYADTFIAFALSYCSCLHLLCARVFFVIFILCVRWRQR